MIFTSATPGPFELKNSQQIVEQIIRPTFLVDPPIEIRPVFDKEKNRSQIDDIIEEIQKIQKVLLENGQKKVLDLTNDTFLVFLVLTPTISGLYSFLISMIILFLSFWFQQGLEREGFAS